MASRASDDVDIKQEPGTQIQRGRSLYEPRALGEVVRIDEGIAEATKDESPDVFMDRTRALFLEVFGKLSLSFALVYQGTNESVVSEKFTEGAYVQYTEFRRKARTTAGQTQESFGGAGAVVDVSKKPFYVPVSGSGKLRTTRFIGFGAKSQYGVSDAPPASKFDTSPAVELNPDWLISDEGMKAAVRLVFGQMLLMVIMWNEMFRRDAEDIAEYFTRVYRRESALKTDKQLRGAKTLDQQLYNKFVAINTAFHIHTKLVDLLQRDALFITRFDANLTAGTPSNLPFVLRAVLQRLGNYLDRTRAVLEAIRDDYVSPDIRGDNSVEMAERGFHRDKVAIAQAALRLTGQYLSWIVAPISSASATLSSAATAWYGSYLIELGSSSVKFWELAAKKRMPLVNTIPYHVFFMQYFDVPRLGLTSALTEYMLTIVKPVEADVKNYVLRYIAKDVSDPEFVERYRNQVPIASASARFSLSQVQFDTIRSTLRALLQNLNTATAAAVRKVAR